METVRARDKRSAYAVGIYHDAVHAEDIDDLHIGEHGYKYRILEGVVMPPYITPSRYKLSRTLLMREGDLCFTGFPKSGSTWLSYILLMITNNGTLSADKTLRDSLQWVASSFTYPRNREYLDSLSSPRIFKSHMPYHMAVGGNPADSVCRHIYIARNPKDVAVSYYHFEKSKSWAGGYNGPWDHWLKMFLEGSVQRGDWFDHVLSWWKHRNAENILFLTYEGLIKDFDSEVRKIARFLGYPISTELLSSIREKTSFHNMQEDEFSNMHEIQELGGFFRRGQVGSWKDRFTQDQSEEFDEIFEARMKGSGLNFSFGAKNKYNVLANEL